MSIVQLQAIAAGHYKRSRDYMREHSDKQDFFELDMNASVNFPCACCAHGGGKYPCNECVHYPAFRP